MAWRAMGIQGHGDREVPGSKPGSTPFFSVSVSNEIGYKTKNGNGRLGLISGHIAHFFSS